MAFHHLKAYEIGNDQEKYSGLGSCNFTERGVFWKKANIEIGNVESMLFERVGGLPWGKVVDLPADVFPQESVGEDAPDPLAFNVQVVFDWKKKEFSWIVQGSLGEELVYLVIDGLPPIDLKSTPKGRQSSRKIPPLVFQIKINESVIYTGMIIETNLADSERNYAKPLKVSAILDAWLRGGEPVVLPDDDDDQKGDENDSAQNSRSEGSMDAAGQPEAFDLFQFYRSVAHIEELLKTKKLDERRARLFKNVDSVYELARTINQEMINTAAKFVVVSECERLFTEYALSEPECRAFAKKIDKMLKSLKQNLEAELQKEPVLIGQKIEPKAVLKWYANALDKWS